MKQALQISSEQNLTIISDSVSYLKKHGKEVIYDAEHFFDGYKQDKVYALQTLAAAAKAGAEILVLCDTNGGTLPWEVAEIVRESKKEYFDSAWYSHPQRFRNSCRKLVDGGVRRMRAGAGNNQRLWRTMRKCQPLHYYPRPSIKNGVSLCYR